MRLDKNKTLIAAAKLGFNQNALAEKAGMNRGNLSVIINGKNAKATTILKIAEALGVEYQEIITED